ncbi:MAG: hypothetical protein AAF443_08840 [Chlamydiota bacterium]
MIRGLFWHLSKKRKSKDGKTHFRVYGRLKGHPVVTATFAKKTEAKQWGQKTEVAMREKHFLKKERPKEHTVSDLIDRYLEEILPNQARDTNNNAFKLGWWKKQLGYCLLCDLTPSLIAEQKVYFLTSMENSC